MKRVFFGVGCAVLGALLVRLAMPAGSGKAPATSSSAAIRSSAISSNAVVPAVSSSAAETAVSQPVTARPPAAVDAPMTNQQDNPAGYSQRQAGTRVFINGRELSQQQVAGIATMYRYAPAPGRYWYDSLSGAWGLEGREAAGFLTPGHDFGTLAEDASNGNTGVFINGRQITTIEVVRLQQVLGAVYRGHWWLDGRSGNFGVEGNPMPVGNLVAAMRAQRSGQRSGDNFWCSVTACGNDDGKSGYVDVGGTIVGYDH